MTNEPVAGTQTHLDSEKAKQYVRLEWGEIQLRAAADHIDGCPDCQRLVAPIAHRELVGDDHEVGTRLSITVLLSDNATLAHLWWQCPCDPEVAPPNITFISKRFRPGCLLLVGIQEIEGVRELAATEMEYGFFASIPEFAPFFREQFGRVPEGDQQDMWRAWARETLDQETTGCLEILDAVRAIANS